MRKTISLTVNRREYELEVNTSDTLLQVLRRRLNLTGTKLGCGEGECGACTVIMDGEAVDSCIILAVEADGAEIETIEGQTVDDELSPVQKAFVESGAIQCGFCTPGMVMSTEALLRRKPDPDEDDIEDALAGNLCRCTGYYRVKDAVRAAAEMKRGEE